VAQPVAWFEITGKDGKKLQDFYAKMFDWKIDANNPMNYGMTEASETGLGGGISASQDGSSNVTVYVAVPDLQAALDKAEKLGGKTVMEPMDVPDGPKIAMFADPEGNVIGLLIPSAG
jgi:predicted enzyme related to lactoylglutathione lyase